METPINLLRKVHQQRYLELLAAVKEALAKEAIVYGQLSETFKELSEERLQNSNKMSDLLRNEQELIHDIVSYEGEA